MIKENLKNIESRIQNACERSGRNRSEITLIAVSKTKPIHMLSSVYNEGIREFGENKVQEMTAKIPQMPSDIKWHLIGHLQTNKVKYIVDKVEMIHSVDSLKLAQEIDKEASKKNRIVNILLEVNIAKEESKFGFDSQELLNCIDEFSKFNNIHVCGLMTIAPFVSNPEENRYIFAALRNLSVDIDAKNIDNVNVKELSMGMTNDFEVAIEEGATMIRVGTAIFGERDYNI